METGNDPPSGASRTPEDGGWTGRSLNKLATLTYYTWRVPHYSRARTNQHNARFPLNQVSYTPVVTNASAPSAATSAAAAFCADVAGPLAVLRPSDALTAWGFAIVEATLPAGAGTATLALRWAGGVLESPPSAVGVNVVSCTCDCNAAMRPLTYTPIFLEEKLVVRTSRLLFWIWLFLFLSPFHAFL